MTGFGARTTREIEHLPVPSLVTPEFATPRRIPAGQPPCSRAGERAW